MQQPPALTTCYNRVLIAHTEVSLESRPPFKEERGVWVWDSCQVCNWGISVHSHIHCNRAEWRMKDQVLCSHISVHWHCCSIKVVFLWVYIGTCEQVQWCCLIILSLGYGNLLLVYVIVEFTNKLMFCLRSDAKAISCIQLSHIESLWCNGDLKRAEFLAY